MNQYVHSTTPSFITIEISSPFEDGKSLEHIQIAVELQQPSGRPAYIRSAENVRTLALEMNVPAILPWMKQSDRIIGIGIETEKIRSLVKIAVHTSEGKVCLDA